MFRPCEKQKNPTAALASANGISTMAPVRPRFPAQARERTPIPRPREIASCRSPRRRAFLSTLSSGSIWRRRCGHCAPGRREKQCHGSYNIWLAKKKRSSRRIRPLNVALEKSVCHATTAPLAPQRDEEYRRGKLDEKASSSDRPAREVFFGAHAGVAQPASKPHTGGSERSLSASSEELRRLAEVANRGLPVHERARERTELRGRIRGKTGSERF